MSVRASRSRPSRTHRGSADPIVDAASSATGATKGAAVPRRTVVPGAGDQLQSEAIGVGEAQDLVAEVEVVGPGVVEVDRALDETQAQGARVEVDVSLRVRRDGRDVMQPGDAARGDEAPFKAPGKRGRLREAHRLTVGGVPDVVK